MKLSIPKCFRMPSGGDDISCLDERQKRLNFFFYAVFLGTFVAFFAILIYYIYAFASLYNGSDAFSWLLSIFSDFVVIMDFSLSDSPYLAEGSSYPPIAIYILYPFALICRSVLARYDSTAMTADELTSKVITTPQFWVALVLFFLLSTAIILFLLFKLFHIRGINMLKLSAVVILSAPFVYAIMRGNTIYFALIFTLLFLVLKDHRNPVLREVSYIALALAGAIKIYPLFFGVFLLKKKRIFASFRVAVYFFLIFFGGFLLVRGETDPIGNFLATLGGFASNNERLFGNNNLSLTADLYKVIAFLTPLQDESSTVFEVFSLTVTAIVFLVSTVAAVTTKSNFSRYIICFAMVALIPTVSYYYITIFAILPFMEFLRTSETMKPSYKTFYTLGFLFLFTSFFVVAYSFGLHSCVIVAMLVLELWHIFRYEWCKKDSIAA